GSKFYLAEGSKIKVADPEGTLQLNNGAEIYNRGTIEAHNLMACVTGTTLYNQGEIKLSGTLSGENNGSTIINEGNITAGGIKTQGGCAFWNSGEIKVNGKIELNSIGNVWVNEGPITTTDFEFMGGSGNVFECCLLTVENELKIDITSQIKYALIVDAEAGIVAKKITMHGPSNIKLGSKAVVKATEKITMDIGTLPVPTGTGFGDGYGVHAIGAEYAVLTAPLIERGPDCTAGWSPFVVSYSGKLYVATDNHFEQAYDGYQQRPHIYWMDDEAKLIEGAGAAPISVSETKCCPGYEPQGDEFLGRIFAEDLNVDEKGDFDFNDVVLDIYKGKDGTYAMLMAAGGTLPIYVGESGANEVHNLFGVSTSTMVNTYANQHAEKAPVKITLPASVSTAADVKIYVAKEEGIIELFVKQGKAPSKILVKSKQTDWADERQSIEVKYSKFKEYVVDPTVVWWED
ncbi:MAG: hypothetical protein HUJ99_06180, partial [Bacteroidaceae bacterium]|nr:hypothetical protein [Bacteroidaceae bacterium]